MRAWASGLLLLGACSAGPAASQPTDTAAPTSSWDPPTRQRIDVFPLRALARQDEAYLAWLTQVPLGDKLTVYVSHEDQLWPGLRFDEPSSSCPASPCFRWTLDAREVRLDVVTVLDRPSADLVAIYDVFDK